MVEKINHAKFVDVVYELMRAGDEGLTCFQLGEVAKCSHYTAQRLMRMFRARKLVHISKWALDAKGRINTPAYAWGMGEDVVRVPLTRSEIHQRYKQRKKLAKGPTTPQRNAAMKILF